MNVETDIIASITESPIWWAMRLVIMYDVIIFIGNVVMSLTSIMNQNITIYTQNNQKEISTDGAI
jgi:hypothetical protein